eukprot:78324_1
MKNGNITFNIGGQRYEVSCSLLKMHPHIMLTKSASGQWQEDPNGEIFIERDGPMFRYVLQYLRDGKVTLPITESKEALVTELHYYGIDYTEDESINEKAVHKLKSFQSVKTAIVDLKDVVENMNSNFVRTEVEYRCAQLALHCIHFYLQSNAPSILDTKHNLRSTDTGGKHELNVNALRNLVTDEVARDKVNMHLNRVGLHLSVYATNMQNNIYGCTSAILEEIEGTYDEHNM